MRGWVASPWTKLKYTMDNDETQRAKLTVRS
jgi:hypothetical protein